MFLAVRQPLHLVQIRNRTQLSPNGPVPNLSQKTGPDPAIAPKPTALPLSSVNGILDMPSTFPTRPEAGSRQKTATTRKPSGFRCNADHFLRKRNGNTPFRQRLSWWSGISTDRTVFPDQSHAPCWRSLMQDQMARSTLIFTRNGRLAIDSWYFIFASHSAEKESLLNQGDSQSVPKWTFSEVKK